MLTHQTRKVLRGIQAMTGNKDHAFGYSSTYTDGEYDLYCPDTDGVYSYDRFAGQIEAIIDFLILEEYLCTDDSGRIPLYRLTYLGMHYHQVNWIRTRAFIARNIILPIVVSAITAFITTWITLQM
jgi:hypothetical protein